MNRLPRYRPWLTVALIAVALGLATAAWAQSKTGPLVLAVSQAGKASLAGETQFVVELRNAGLVAVTLPARPGWDAEGGLEMRVTPVGAVATTARSVPHQPDPTRNTRLAANRRGLALPSGEALGIYRTVKTNDLFPSTGDYEVVVAYRGLGGGEVVSAPLRVSVIP
jgi:hypothetical protein